MPSLESSRLVIFLVPGLYSGIFSATEKHSAKKCKGNKSHKSSDDGPGSVAGFGGRREPAELSVMKTDLEMLKSIYSLQWKIRSTSLIWATVSSRKKQWKQNHCRQLLHAVCNLSSLMAPCEATASAVLLSIPYLGPGRVPPPSHVTFSSALLPRARLGLAAAEAVVHLLYLRLQPAVLGAEDLQGAVPHSTLRRALALPRDMPPETRRANISPGMVTTHEPTGRLLPWGRSEEVERAVGLWDSADNVLGVV